MLKCCNCGMVVLNPADKIGAIKHYRQCSGLGLRESKEAVERFYPTVFAPPPMRLRHEDHDELWQRIGTLHQELSMMLKEASRAASVSEHTLCVHIIAEARLKLERF